MYYLNIGNKEMDIILNALEGYGVTGSDDDNHFAQVAAELVSDNIYRQINKKSSEDRNDQKR